MSDAQATKEAMLAPASTGMAAQQTMLNTLPASHPLKQLDGVPRIDDAIADARSLPALLAKLKTASPDAYGQLVGKPLIASRSPWGTITVAIVAWLASRYGLGWDEGTCTIVGGLGVIAGSYAMRWLTTSPIRSVFTTTRSAP